MNNSSNLESIFFAALEKHSPAERSAFLDKACATDDELRRRVERMLAAQAAAGSFLESPAADLAAIPNSLPRYSGEGLGEGSSTFWNRSGERSVSCFRHPP